MQWNCGTSRKLKEAYEILLGYMWEWFCTFSIQGQGRVDFHCPDI